MKQALLSVLLLCGCGDLLSFDIDRSIPEQQVMGNPIGGALPGLLGVGIPVDLDLEQETQARNTGPVSKVSLSALSLAVTTTSEPAGDIDDLAFIDSIDVFVSSTRADTTLPRLKVAELRNVADGQRSVSFETTDVNIQDHIEEGARIETEASGTAPDDDVSYDGSFTITVDIL